MTYRDLRDDERKLIERIISYQPLRHPPEVSLHFGNSVREIFPDGTLEFAAKETSSSRGHIYYPVEAQFIDDDGAAVQALVFYNSQSQVTMLEILKGVGSDIIRKPPPEEWEIMDLSSRQDRPGPSDQPAADPITRASLKGTDTIA